MASKYFSDREVKCKCGQCDGDNHMKPEFMGRLDALRELYGKPMILSSAYRCPEHNSKVSSTGATGPHTTGRAVDVAVYGVDCYEILRLALKMGFTGIGIKQKGEYGLRFIHLDDLEYSVNRPRVWSY